MSALHKLLSKERCLEVIATARFFFLIILSCCFFLILLQTKLSAQTSKEEDSLNKALLVQKNTADRINTLFALGKYYYNKSDYRKALENDRILIDLIGKHGTKADSAKAFRHIGLVMMEMSWYDESLDYIMQAQDLYSQTGDTAKQATSLMNVGIVHDYLGNLPMALSYYNKALGYFVKIKDEAGIANCKLNTGIILTKQKKFTEACDHFLEAAEIYQKTNNQNYLAASYLNLGLAYKNQKNYELAMEYHNKAFDIYSKQDDKYHICHYYLNIGELLLRMNKAEEAKSHLDNAKTLAEEMGSMDLKARAYEFLSDYYVKTNNWEPAYRMLLKSKIINDSILNAQMVESVSKIQYRYEIVKRESEKVQLVKDNLQNELKLEQRTRLMYVLSGLLLMIIVLVVILILWNRSKHRANIELEAKNKLILSQKNELVKLNASKDRFLSILAHDIKNPISAILGISDIVGNDYDSLTEEERRGFVKDINTSATNLFEIVNTLLNWSISQSGIISYQPRDFNLHILCTNVIARLHTIAKLKDVSLHDSTDQDLNVYADDNMITSVVQNLVTNAIKYSNKGGRVEIASKLVNGSVEISVSDTGTGISPENQAKLFRYDQTYRSRGTSGESGTGLGLILCKDFVEKNEGKIWVESEPGKGSSFKFTLPVMKNAQV
jgi:signal transduction histidine kinase